MSNDQLIKAMSNADDDIVFTLVRETLDMGDDPTHVLHDLTKGMELLGERFACGEAFIPEIVYGSEVFSQAVEILRPSLGASVSVRENKAKVMIATVLGDVHEIGKGLVAIFLELAGYEVIDLGHDMANEQIIAAIEKEKPAVVGLSALMTTTMLQQREFIKALKQEGLRDGVKVIVGGAPINKAWADEIGADAFGADALDARMKIDTLLGY